MSILIQNVEVKLGEVISSSLNGIQNINGYVHNSECNHIMVPGYEAFVFDFSKVILSETLTTNLNYGISYNSDKTLINLNISY
jgi:hypothetical protein